MEISPRHRKILVALDGSGDILSWAIENLIFPSYSSTGSLPSDHIVLLHVQPSAQIFISDLEEDNNESLTFIRKNQDEESQRILRNAKSICDEHRVRLHGKSIPATIGLCSELKVEVGEPREAICEVADKIQPTFLILGSHGHGSVKRLLLGSVSDYCVHHVSCPVFIVRKG